MIHPRLLVIDTETGGIDPLRYSILSLGCVVYEDGKVLGEIEIFVAEREILSEPEALKVNRIDLVTQRAVGIPPQVAVERLEAFLAQYFPPTQVTLAGHNVSFDVGFLRRLYRLANKDYEARFSHRLIDTASVLAVLRLAERISVPNTGLEAALRYFSIAHRTEGRHTALVDARATAHLLGALVRLLRNEANAGVSQE